MWKDKPKEVTWNSPPYIPIPFSKALRSRLVIQMTAEQTRDKMAIRENSMDLSRLMVTALVTNCEINDKINNYNKDIHQSVSNKPENISLTYFRFSLKVLLWTLKFSEYLFVFFPIF